MPFKLLETILGCSQFQGPESTSVLYNGNLAVRQKGTNPLFKEDPGQVQTDECG